MHRASVLTPALEKRDYKLICYSPTNVNKQDKTVTGYSFENNEFKQVCVAIPKINYDFCIGPDDLNTYSEFLYPWALDQGYKFYPTKIMRKLAQDKLLAAKTISKFDNSTLPYTEIFNGSIEQIKTFFLDTKNIFIKPRYGARGNKIIVVKSKNKQHILFTFGI